MAEYLERKRALADISRLLVVDDIEPKYQDAWETAIIKAMSIVEKAPAADVRPERHGRWIEKRGYNIPMDVYEVSYNCNCCGNMVYNKYTFCPNCGAMMDGKDGESDENNSDNP